MVYEITFLKADQWHDLPFVQLVNFVKNIGITQKIQVMVSEVDAEWFEAELDHHPHVKRWRRTGGRGWPEITATYRSAG